MPGLEGMTPEAVSDLATLATTLANNPKTRAHFLRLTKMANPEVQIPEIEMADQLNGILSKGAERIKSMEDKLMQREMQDRLSEARRELREQGIAKEDIAEVEKLMVERRIPDHKTAAEFFNLSRKAAEPTPSRYSGVGVEVPKIDLTKVQGANINAWARQEAANTLSDIIKNRSRIAA